MCPVCLPTAFCYVLQAAINGEVIGNFDSYAGWTFNALGIQGVAVQNVTFATVDLPENDWISFVEVSFACCLPPKTAIHGGYTALQAVLREKSTYRVHGRHDMSGPFEPGCS